MKPSDYVVAFDSSTAMLLALSKSLRGEGFPMMGSMSDSMEPVMKPLGAFANEMPETVRETVYSRSGAGEATSREDLAEIHSEDVSRWTTGHYPKGKYPVVAVGSTNGALTHMYAALGIPWLPQTFLATLENDRTGPDDPVGDLEMAREAVGPLLEANPDLALHQMLDPNQDRLMARRMTYLRFKRLRLGEEFERFLDENLEEGGTILVPKCGLTWPTTRVSERHVFQFGGFGGAAPEEYLHGGERVEAYLERYNVDLEKWHPPGPDGESPEAEWGFEPEFAKDIERFARERGFEVREIFFDEPDDASPFVADLYRGWYEKNGVAANRLLVETFIMMDPHLAIRTGSVPFWAHFNTDPAAEAVEEYLDGGALFDEIHATLFSHGVDSIGVAPIERWKAVVDRAKKRGSLLGADERTYPKDFAAFARYHDEISCLPHLEELPAPLTTKELEDFTEEASERYAVRWG